MKIGYQLKQVRERLAKGLVDKGILRTEKRNFLLFDMATHPVADGGAKDEIRRRVRNVLTSRTVVLPGNPFLPEDMDFRFLRTVVMVCAAYAANVLENALATLGHEARERAFAHVDELLAEYSQWPFGKRNTQSGVGQNLGQATSEEINNNKDRELQIEVSLQMILVIGFLNADLLFLFLLEGGLSCSKRFYKTGLASIVELRRQMVGSIAYLQVYRFYLAIPFIVHWSKSETVVLGRGQLSHAMFVLSQIQNEWGGGCYLLYDLCLCFVLQGSSRFTLIILLWCEFMKYIPYINIDKCLESGRPAYFFFEVGGGYK